MTITIADGRGALWQWDTGRRLRVGSGVEQVHYQNKCFGRSVDVDVGDDGTAIIPDELLQDCHTLTAYAYVTDDTGAYTMAQRDFIVHKRSKPAGYVYTPTDQITLQAIQRQIGDLADLTTDAKENLVAAINEVARTGGGAGSMDLRVADGYIQYSTDSGNTWQNLIAVEDLKGAKGDTGATGQRGPKGDPGETGPAGPQGPAGVPGKDGADGKPGAAGTDGAKGADGITPHIGDNGHWYLGAEDTGKPSRGATGAKGDAGATGPDGPAGPVGPQGPAGSPGKDGTKGDPGAPGKDGHSPVVTATKSGKTTTISVDGAAIATVEDGADGAPGENGVDGKPGAAGADGAKGADGITPHIGDNGNWYIGDDDTGKPSRGEQGPGAEVYYVDLAGTYPSYTCATAMADIAAAYASGKELKCRFAMGVYTAVLPLFLPKPSANTWLFSGAGALSAMGFPAQTMTIAIVNGTVQASDTRLASMDDIPTIPTALKNPNALTIKIGSTTVTYDGSAAQTVTIADGTEVEY